MDKKVRAILYGVGPLGAKIARAILERKSGIEIVGAIDLANVGKDVGDLVGIGRKTGVAVTDSPESVLGRMKADVVIHATSSRLPDVTQQLAQCVQAGLNVVSSCEELSFPYYKYPDITNDLDQLARQAGVTVLGTGVNPGFLMDSLPIFLTSICQDVEDVKVTRMMYSGTRRPSYQKKIGTGMAPRVFAQLINEKKITGHVGLVESVAMIAAALGWKLDEIEELPVEAILCDEQVQTWTDPSKKELLTLVMPGQVAGLKSVAEGRLRGIAKITLEFVSHANVKEPYDSVQIEGSPRISQKIEGGVHGDSETVAMMINSISRTIDARPGLRTMKDDLPACAA